MKHGFIYIILSVLLLSACSGDNGPTDATSITRVVKVDTVREASLAGTRHFVGRVEAIKTVDLAFQVAGRIEQMPVQEGTVVSRGSLIAALEPVDYELALRQAEVALEVAELAHQRNDRMLPRDAVPLSTWERSRAELQTRRVARDVHQRNLDLTRLEAPFDALITRRLVDPFTQIQAGTSVVRIQDMTELRIRASIPEDLMYLLGQTSRLRAAATLSAWPGRSFELHYREHVTEPDPVAQTYDILFEIDPADDISILPGMTATVMISSIAELTASGIRVPVAALDTRDGDGLRVWIYDADTGTAIPRAVQAGPITGQQALILSGLRDGEQIITAGAHLLHEGMSVAPMTAR